MGVLLIVHCCSVGCGGGGGGGGDGGSGSGSGGNSTPPPPPPPPASFFDITATSGIAYRVGFTDYPQSLIDDVTFGGAASGDCDGDGDIDLFITYGDGSAAGSAAGGGPNRLYLNQATQGIPFAFVDTADAAHVAYTGGVNRNDRHSGPSFADMDGDGDLDLFLGGIYGDPNRIYENAGDCTFEDVTDNSPGIRDMRAAHTISAAFGDYDLDGRIDLFLTHWGTPDSTYEPPNPAESEHLWRNVSDSSGISFVNVSAQSGVTSALWATRGYGVYQLDDYTFTPTFARIDGDVWPDIVIAADGGPDGGTNQVLINNRDGTFRNATTDVLKGAQFGMGSALGDIDNDGDLDWFVTSIFGAHDSLNPLGNRLFRNDSASAPAAPFVDITDSSGTANGRWGWAACFADLDNDADLDIYHTNGWSGSPFGNDDDFRFDVSRAFMNLGGAAFSERAASLGLADSADARGVVCADFDADGDIDLLQLTNNRTNSATLWENRSAAAGKNYLRVRLVGLSPNTAAAGARIFVTVGGTRYLREVTISNNYVSQNPTEQVFGLGTATIVDELRVEWPAIVSGPGMPSEPTTVLLSHEVRPISSGTLVIPHPDLP